MAFNVKTESRGNQNLLLIMSILSGGMSLLVLIFGFITNDGGVLGTSLVQGEFPPTEYFPIYLKPITWFYGAILVFCYSIIQLMKTKIIALPRPLITFIKVVAFATFGVAIYEIFFNFTLWSALMSQGAISGNLNPDVLFNPFPNADSVFVMNLVFATKIYTLLGLVSGYIFYFLNSIEK